MKTSAILLAFTLVSTAAVADTGTAAPAPATDPPATACTDGEEGPRIAAVLVSATDGEAEIVDIRISGRNANAFDGMAFEIDGMREIAPAMTKTAGSNGNGNPNNGTSLWTIEYDLDRYADENGEVLLRLRPSCCYIPGAIVVRSKGR